jgi:hypothetical protein
METDSFREEEKQLAPGYSTVSDTKTVLNDDERQQVETPTSNHETSDYNPLADFRSLMGPLLDNQTGTTRPG